MAIDISKAIVSFFEKVTSLAYTIKNDEVWPKITDEILKDKDEDFKISFWLSLEESFKKKEETIGHCHKGMIFWSLANLYLSQGKIKECIAYLKKSVDEDNIRNEKQFTAAKGMLSVLGLLFYRYKNGKEWMEDNTVLEFYNLLSIDERKKFAEKISITHNLLALQSGMMVIKEEFFNFITDETNRQVLHDTYNEVRDIILKTELPTYYSCVFSIGSIIEAMIDDLFKREKGEIWKIFHNNSAAQKEIEKGSPLLSATYKDSMTLGQKIKALELMVRHDISPIQKETVLQIRIIGEYRDLIHPRRRLKFDFEANKYVVMSLFTFISHIANDWWPDNVNKLLEKHRLS